MALERTQTGPLTDGTWIRDKRIDAILLFLDLEVAEVEMPADETPALTLAPAREVGASE